MKIQIIAHNQFIQPRDMSNKALRQLVKQRYALDGRRQDNFTLAGLAAAASLRDFFIAPGQMALVTCAEYFSIELVQKMLLDLHEKRPIGPVDFVTTVGNAANFFIARALNIHAGNLFVGVQEGAKAQAFRLSATHLYAHARQYVVQLVWEEREDSRICHAWLIRAVEPQVQQIKSVAFDDVLQSTGLKVPCVTVLPPV